jgi:hypothetical protein
MHRILPLALILAVGTGASAAAPASEDTALAVAQLSTAGCYGIASGEIAVPNGDDPAGIDKATRLLEGLGLGFGLPDKAMSGLGAPGTVLVSRATMGSKSLGQAELIMAFGGAQPGCRVLLIAEPAVGLADGIAAQLTQAGWKAVPSMTGQRSGLERRAFLRRDAKGMPFLMNLMTVITPFPGSRLQLFTTTTAIPAEVQLPDGF